MSYIDTFIEYLFSENWNEFDFICKYSSLAANEQHLKKSVSKIHKIYSNAPEKKDGLSRLAFLLWGEQHYSSAHELWEEDIKNKRISWRQHLRYADTFAEIGNLEAAEKIAAEVYSCYPEAKGAYAGIAWRIRNTSPEKAQELFERDETAGKLNNEFAEKYAVFLAYNKNYDRALALLDKVKLQKPSAYHKIAETMFVDKKWDLIPALYKRAPFDNWFKSYVTSNRITECRDNSTLYAFYDLMGCGPTFDIAVFLGHCERERIKKGLKSIKLIIVPATPDFFAGWYPASQETQSLRLQNIVLPVISMMKSCTGIEICSSRDEALIIDKSIAEHKFPEDYSVERPTVNFYFRDRTNGEYPVQYIEPSPTSEDAVKSFFDKHLKGRKPITITLRETASINKDRNSNIPEWLNFAKYTEQNGFYPIILRDTDKVYLSDSKLKKYTVMPEASLNLDLRAALYKHSYLNLGVNNGPMMFCILMKNTKALIFKILSESSNVTSSVFLKEHCGLQLETQFPFFNKFQKFIWQDDKFDVILDSFNKMVKDIES